MGFSPQFFAHPQASCAVWIIFWSARKTGFYGIVVNISPMILKSRFINNANIGESALPNVARESEFAFGAKGKSALDQLHCLFNAHLPRDRHQDVNVIGHDHEVVYANSPGPHGRTQNINEQIGRAFCLEKGFAARRPGGDEERSLAAGGIVGA